MRIIKSQVFSASRNPSLSPHLPYQNGPQAILMVSLAGEFC